MGIEVKQMADLLKSGATMLQQTCPQCGTPLFRKGKETFCPKCNRPVVIIESAEDENRLLTMQILESTEQTLLTKIKEINSAIKAESDPEKLVAYGNALSTWLSAIEKLRSLKAQNAQ
ncbi:MAG TPA: Sjogren's syndrome/scleroderma autoantigen 1 family protein [Candidatus Acidoferrum sp.]|nr:Sjogren's syndrome/scleroderma autoantigen 1 family protein [Candidatus Acidoferrum sp.]